jgi:hypothetical protein
MGRSASERLRVRTQSLIPGKRSLISGSAEEYCLLFAAKTQTDMNEAAFADRWKQKGLVVQGTPRNPQEPEVTSHND